MGLVRYVYDADETVRHFELVNDEVLSFDGETVDITPGDLITG